MPKLRKTNTITTYVVKKPKSTAVDKRLERKQKLEDRLDQIMEAVDGLNLIKENEYFSLEDIKAQENFIKRLTLEATIAKEPKNRRISPAIKIARIKRKIVALKTKIDFLKNAFEQQRRNLLTHKKNRDLKNYELTKRFMLKLEKEIKDTNTKYQEIKKIFRLFAIQSKSLLKR